MRGLGLALVPQLLDLPAYQPPPPSRREFELRQLRQAKRTHACSRSNSHAPPVP
jgi:hypothetical protein